MLAPGQGEDHSLPFEATANCPKLYKLFLVFSLFYDDAIINASINANKYLINQIYV